MFSLLKLGKLFGIGLYVHATFWLLPLFVFLGGVMGGDVSGATMDVAVLFAVFGCVVLHEVGHALAAAYYGIATRDITLYPVGGVARLERMPERPLHEIVVALAGPAVNVVIALGLFAGIYFGNVALPGSFFLSGLDVLDEFVLRVLLVNVFLVAFNLIPAFPMDGGRVLRAMLGTVMHRTSATHAAVTVGSVIAAGFVLVGLGGLSVPPIAIEPMPTLALVGAVVFLLGRMELAQVRAIEGRREWERRSALFGDFEIPTLTRPPAFSGWRWDPVNRVWTEWHDGVLVREVRPTA
jgi:Zn-dependent protease